ncbi:MAG: HXXEE domain-containing protein [Candidatus Lokiarchaeota archaeon]
MIKIDRFYDYWAKAGFITALFLLILLIFNSKTPIGSFGWFYWLSLPIYMFHQFEEYVYPGGFKDELNELLRKDESDQEVLTDKLVIFVNIGFIWILNPVLIILNAISIIFPIILMTIVGFNGIVHVFTSLRFRKYNPGLIMSVIGNIPLSVYVILGLGLTGTASILELIVGICIGIVLHMLLFIMLFLRSRKI